MEKNRIKITLAIPTNRGVKAKTVESLLSLVNNSIEFEFNFVIAEHGYTTAENRNYCVVQAKKNNSDYLLFVDDDMTFPDDTLDRLISHKKEIIGVASNSRILPLSTTVGLMDEEGNYMHPDKNPTWKMKLPEELFKAYFVGTGVMLIDMKVFEKLSKPYFTFTSNEDGKVIKGEDGYFCEEAKKAGYEIWCDPTISIGHIGDFIY